MFIDIIKGWCDLIKKDHNHRNAILIFVLGRDCGVKNPYILNSTLENILQFLGGVGRMLVGKN